jgi:hypothetical protein
LGTGAFVHAPELAVPTFWTAGDDRAPQITAWCGGPRALRLAELSEAALTDAVMRSLAEVSSQTVSGLAPLIAGLHVHRFSLDPLSRGAYPYLLVGGDMGGAFESEAETLFFAGDYMDPRELGTVGSSVERGAQCARAVLESRLRRA